MIFLEVATIFTDTNTAGNIGASIAQYNILLFGYLAYVYPIFLLYPIFCFYKTSKFSFRRLELIIAFFLCVFSLLFLQALIFDLGLIGQNLVIILKNTIGAFGVWAISIVFLFLSIVIFCDASLNDIASKTFSFINRAYDILIKKVFPQIKNIILVSCDFTGAFSKKMFNKKRDTKPDAKQEHKADPNAESERDIFYHNSYDEISPYNIIETNAYFERDSAPLGPIKISKKEIPQISESKDTTTYVAHPQYSNTPQHSTDERKITRKILAGSILDNTRRQNILSAQSNIDYSYLLSTQSQPTSAAPAYKPQKILDDATLDNMIQEVIKDDNPYNIEIKEIEEDGALKHNKLLDMLELDDIYNEPFHADQNVFAPRILTEIKENKEMLGALDYGKSEIPKNFTLPPLSLLTLPNNEKKEIDESEIDRKSHSLLEKLGVFKINGDIKSIYTGPVVTTFEFRPATHVKVSRILSLEDDLKMTLRAKSIRIQAPIPGKDVVGIEIANNHIETIYLREILSSEIFKNSRSALTIALGKDIVGNPFVTDLRKLPQLLIAGTTGSGKSVGVNAMILSMLYKNSPEHLKLMMIDPKKVEFSLYEDIPHLITPIITDPKKAVLGLKNAVAEMLRRYDLMTNIKTKEIDSYNIKAKRLGNEVLPYFVIVIDELADLMMSASKEVEIYITRIAQLGRAAGIHLIVATQRPSVDVVTGIIKANLPARISFRVGSKIDSKVILDMHGAESLMGNGDMLFTAQNGVVRLHAPYSNEAEIEKIVNFIKKQSEARYDSSFLKEHDSAESINEISIELEGNDILNQAKKIIIEDNKTSISNIQRRLNIGYNKAANIIEALEKEGFLSKPNNQGIRTIL